MSQSSQDYYDTTAAQLAYSDEVEFQATALEEDDQKISERHQKDEDEDGEFKISQQSSQDCSSDFSSSQSSEASNYTSDDSETDSDEEEDCSDGKCTPSTRQGTTKHPEDDPEDPTYYPHNHRKEDSDAKAGLNL